ncbi:MAG: hypothetical protein HFE76_05865 [Firmicutes bacterium]|nr:hypothetical protein [Bacillota bacterium]
MEVMKMTAKEILNLGDWLRAEGYSGDKIIECIKVVKGRKKPNNND